MNRGILIQFFGLIVHHPFAADTAMQVDMISFINN